SEFYLFIYRYFISILHFFINIVLNNLLLLKKFQNKFKKVLY
ncbi:hypothetical protein LCGC14_2622680, partial [marine sediment metagenome]